MVCLKGQSHKRLRFFVSISCDRPSLLQSEHYCYDRQLFEIAYFFGSQKVSLKTPLFPVTVDIFFDLH
jgi:hypothetical protein